MTSAVPETVKDIDEELDDLSLRVLDLSQELINTKLDVEKRMKNGFLNLAKARYSMGYKQVSGLQLPTEDWDDFAAKVKVNHDECLRKENHVRFCYFSMSDGTSSSVETLDSALVNRKQKDSGDTKKSPDKRTDPLKWFGILVPTALRQSQQDFQKSAEVAIICANLQSEINGIVARQKFLCRQKSKLQKEQN